MKGKLLLIFLVAILLIFSFFTGIKHGVYAQKSEIHADGTEREESSEATPGMVEGLDAVEAMALANKWGEEKNSVTSSVTPASINFEFPGGVKVSVSLPEDRMVVAIAPYVKTTHTCKTHSMSGCRGELFGEDVNIVAKKMDGETILETNMKTMPNGFVELWLPRDLEIDLRITYKNRVALGTITTNSDSKTCVTTMQLK